MMNIESLTVAVLAGGQSRRMGRDKSFVMLNGRPLIEHVLERVTPLAQESMIITNTPHAYQHLGYPLFTDEIPNCGSLGGLYTALRRATTPYVLCVACDMPFLNPALLTRMSHEVIGYDAIIPRTTDGIAHNLHAVYAQHCQEVIHAQLVRGNLRIRDFYQHLRIYYMDEAAIRTTDPLLHSLVNLNTPNDLHTWRPSKTGG